MICGVAPLILSSFHVFILFNYGYLVLQHTFENVLSGSKKPSLSASDEHGRLFPAAGCANFLKISSFVLVRDKYTFFHGNIPREVCIFSD
jgi:hypothetical protein